MTTTVSSSHWFARLVTGIFTVLIVGLSALFWITLFAPGNDYTRWIFNLLAPVTGVLQYIYHWVGYPVQWVCQWIASFLPEPLKALFPTTTVKTLITSILDLGQFIPGFKENAIVQVMYNLNYQYWFPGILDWQILLTIRLLNWVEPILTPKPQGVFNPKLQTMINQNRTQFLEEWEQNQPFTPETLSPPAVSGHNSIATSQNVHSDFFSFDESPVISTQQNTKSYPIRPLPSPQQQPVPSSTEDPATGLMNRQAFQILFNTQWNWTQKHKQPIGVVWLELATLSVAPPQTLLQLGRWLKNLSPKQGKLIPVRYGEHSIVVLLVNQSEAQASLVAQHLNQRLTEFHFAPLIGMAHSSQEASLTPGQFIERAYQKALASSVSSASSSA